MCVKTVWSGPHSGPRCCHVQEEVHWGVHWPPTPPHLHAQPDLQVWSILIRGVTACLFFPLPGDKPPASPCKHFIWVPPTSLFSNKVSHAKRTNSYFDKVKRLYYQCLPSIDFFSLPTGFVSQAIWLLSWLETEVCNGKLPFVECYHNFDVLAQFKHVCLPALVVFYQHLYNWFQFKGLHLITVISAFSRSGNIYYIPGRSPNHVLLSLATYNTVQTHFETSRPSRYMR